MQRKTLELQVSPLPAPEEPRHAPVDGGTKYSLPVQNVGHGPSPECFVFFRWGAGPRGGAQSQARRLAVGQREEVQAFVPEGHPLEELRLGVYHQDALDTWRCDTWTPRPGYGWVLSRRRRLGKRERGGLDELRRRPPAADA